MRVVLDTHILISAFVFPGGAPEDVFRAALEGRIVLVTSPVLLAEFGRVLSSNFGWGASLAKEAVAQVARIGKVVRPEATIAEIADDPDDDRSLEAALAGRAEVIVSGDRHLLRLRRWRGIEIEKAAQFLRSFTAFRKPVLFSTELRGLRGPRAEAPRGRAPSWGHEAR